IRHTERCKICREMPRPVADVARAACELAGVDVERFVYDAAELTESERTHYLDVAHQAVAIALEARIHKPASNTDLVDALGVAFSLHYAHARHRGPARRVRELHEKHALDVRRELQLAGIDLEGISRYSDATALYTVTRMTTMRKEKRQPGRRIVTLVPEAVAKFEELMATGRFSSPSWLPAGVEGQKENATDERAEIEGRGPRFSVLAEKKYEVVESGERATKVLDLLERTTMRLDVAAFREDLRIADEARLRLAEQLELRGIVPERTRTRAEERARLLEINHRAQELF